MWAAWNCILKGFVDWRFDEEVIFCHFHFLVLFFIDHAGQGDGVGGRAVFHVFLEYHCLLGVFLF